MSYHAIIRRGDMMDEEFVQPEPQPAVHVQQSHGYGAGNGFIQVPVGEAANHGYGMPEQRRMPENRKVRRELLSIHIFLIVISGTIGMGLFDNSGEILRIAGPAGGITAFGVVGIAVIFVMEGIAEMIAHWPISNAMFEFVKRFVDKELALVVGAAYWLAYSVSFGTLICAASNLATEWTWPTPIQDIVFIAFAPLLLLFVNCFGVKWYGNVEAFCGILKIFLVVGAFLTMCIINKLDTENAKPPVSRAAYINDGFKNDPNVASHPIIAIFVALPIATYAYIGVEIVAVTAVEAKTPKRSLRLPARNIAWITGLFYFLSVIVFYFNVSYQDENLPGYHLRDGGTNSSNSSMALIIIAAKRSEVKGLPTALSGFLIIAILSAANTALYVASRTLWGVACDFDPQLIRSPNRIKRWWSRLSTTTPSKVPGWALFVSCFSFIWIPILQGVTKNAISSQNLQQVMSGIATVGVVLVWASQCWAFIRYRAWLWANRDELIGPYAAFNHFDNDNQSIPFTSIVGWMQTFPAWVGLIFCVIIVFIFSTASWWNGKERKDADIPAAFAAPAGFLAFWILLKAIRWWRAVEQFEFFIRVGSWIGPPGQDGLKAKLDGLTAAIKSLEDERNDPNTGVALDDVSPGSSRRNLQYQGVGGERGQGGVNANDVQQQQRRQQQQHSYSGSVGGSASVSAASFVNGEGNAYSFPPRQDGRRDRDRDWNGGDLGAAGQYQFDEASQASGRRVARSRSRSPPRRRTSLYTNVGVDPRYQYQGEGEGSGFY